MLFNAPLFCSYSGRRRRSIPSGPGCLHSLYLSSVDQVRTLDTFPVCFCMWFKKTTACGDVGPPHINDKSSNVSKFVMAAEAQMRPPLICAAVSSHLSDHPEHPHGHVIEQEPPPPPSLHAPNILALLEDDDGRAVDAADPPHREASPPQSAFTVSLVPAASLWTVCRQGRAVGWACPKPSTFCGASSSTGVDGGGGQYPQLLVPNKRNLKQTLQLKSTLLNQRSVLARPD